MRKTRGHYAKHAHIFTYEKALRAVGLDPCPCMCMEWPGLPYPQYWLWLMMVNPQAEHHGLLS
jgi:hypothetical protein